MNVADMAVIGLIVSIFPPELVDSAVEDVGSKEVRRRALPARLVTYFVIAMAVWPQLGYVGVLEKLATALRWTRAAVPPFIKIPSDGSIAKARARLGDEALHRLFELSPEQAGAPSGSDGPVRAGRRICSLTGALLALPDTFDNRHAFDVPPDQEVPQGRLLMLGDNASRAVLGAAFEGAGTEQSGMVRSLLGRTPGPLLVLVDPDLPAADLLHEIRSAGADAAWRLAASEVWTPLSILADGSCLAVLGDGAGQPPLRVVEFSSASEGGASPVTHRLATTVVDPDVLPAQELVRAHLERFRTETVFQLLTRSRPDLRSPFRSRSPELVRQELWGMLCCYQALRLLVVAPIAGGTAGHGEETFPAKCS
ncbi:hypothetical protein GCM10010430_62460 [Kitasatospora cystarginea]|uniref:Transposase IS4 N-terminal domain-containing protein n=2 Tax=Kitasatospora cystarginea TaxID=58350 RepID=A0ABN3ES07_9ACTN